MTSYLVLLSPASNRVYTSAADQLGQAELEILLNREASDQVSVTPVTLAGVGYLEVELPEDRLTKAPAEPGPDPETPDPETLAALGRLSSFFALFRRSGNLLAPVAVRSHDAFEDDLISIPKYPGKTNEQFTRLLINVTWAALQPAETGAGSRRIQLLDPLCGRGTTLSTGLMSGWNVAGVELDTHAVEAYASFLRTYLRRKRLKHRAELNPVRREGKSLGRRLEVEVAPSQDLDTSDHTPLRLDVFTGDTRQSRALYGKRRFDLIVTDAPYGVAHGSHSDVRGTPAGKRDRSAAGLLAAAIPVWASQLRPGGALGLSWNTYGMSREQLNEVVHTAGLVPLTEGPYLRLGHRVDSSIQRDVLVAVKPLTAPPPDRRRDDEDQAGAKAEAQVKTVPAGGYGRADQQ